MTDDEYRTRENGYLGVFPTVNGAIAGLREAVNEVMSDRCPCCEMNEGCSGCGTCECCGWNAEQGRTLNRTSCCPVMREAWRAKLNQD
jgi:hypothetical protein